MNYLIIAIFAFTVGFCTAYFTQRTRIEHMRKNHNQLVNQNNELVTKNNELLESLTVAIDTSTQNRELYLSALELYRRTVAHSKEISEDLDFAKAIISGDLSYINE